MQYVLFNLDYPFIGRHGNASLPMMVMSVIVCMVVIVFVRVMVVAMFMGMTVVMVFVMLVTVVLAGMIRSFPPR